MEENQLPPNFAAKKHVSLLILFHSIELNRLKYDQDCLALIFPLRLRQAASYITFTLNSQSARLLMHLANLIKLQR